VQQGTWYRASARPWQQIEPAAGSSAARVVVVGGGFAGVATALGLAERGWRDVVLLEAQGIGHGASGRNGGFVFGGYSLGEDALLKQLGPVRARRVYQRTVDAVRLIRQRIHRYRIDCDLVDEGVLWANWFRDPSVLARRADLIEQAYGVRWESVPSAELRGMLATERYHGALLERDAFHVHPLDYVRGAARTAMELGVRVHEHSPVRSLERAGAGWRLKTDSANLSAEHVVLCCGGYLAGLVPAVDRSILPIATYVMVTEALGRRLEQDVFTGTRAAVYDTRFAFDYYRPLPDTRLLWGGRISILDRSPEAVARLLKRDLLRVFPQLADVRIEYAWSGLMGYPAHQMPQLHQIAPGLWSGQGFGGHGFATTTAAGEVLADAIAEGGRAIEDYAPFGLASTHKPLGFLGAQATYWWLESRDAVKDLAEGLVGR
jgi:gamma-glutamylputrescine oxidase